MQSIIEGYVYEVVKNLNENQKEDLKHELISQIHEMINKKANGKEPTEDDAYAVIKELGNPNLLAKKYVESEKKMFLKYEYFKIYKRVILLTLPIVIGIFILGAYTSSVGTQENWLKVVMICLESALIGFCFYFTIVTFIFMILQYLKVGGGNKNNFANTEASKVGRKYSSGISYVALGSMSILGITMFVKPALIFSAVVDMKRISIFDEFVLNDFKYLIIIILIVTLIRESYNLLTKGVGTESYLVILFLDLIQIGMIFALFLRPRILNPEFVEIFKVKFYDKQIIVEFFSNFNYWIAGMFLVAILLRGISEYNSRFRKTKV